MSVALIGTFAAVISIAGVVFYTGRQLLDVHGIQSERRLTSKTLFDLVKLAFGVVAGAGALVALVVAYRRQREPPEGAALPLSDWQAGPRFWPEVLPNVWLGVSVEDQKWADIRVPTLLDTPAAVRFLSAEPLLGPIDLSAWMADQKWPSCWDDHSPTSECGRCIRPDWVIVGGESGAKARPMHPNWARSLRDQCQDAGVAYLFKQWGTWGLEPRSTPMAASSPARSASAAPWPTTAPSTSPAT